MHFAIVSIINLSLIKPFISESQYLRVGRDVIVLILF